MAGPCVGDLLSAPTSATRCAGHAVPHTVGARRPGDSPKLVGNISKARHELGWTPKRDLAVQIEDTLRWRRKMLR